MGRIKVRNLLLSKKLKRSETRLLIIDDNQIRYNEILEVFQNKDHLVHATLLDDLHSFEKQLNTNWDVVIFGRAYDLKIEQTITLIQASSQINIPVLLLKPEDYQTTQYPSYIHKGMYDVVNLDYPERFYIGLIRALSYSRTLQGQRHLLNELENAKNQAQALVQEQHKAVAVLQEGIHIEANDEYLKLFGLTSQDELIGLPILDILQPKNLPDFKNRFKKVSQGQFELARFEIDTLNQHAQSENPLKIEFLPGSEDDAIQITIETQSATLSHTSQAELTASNNSNNKNSIFQQISRTLLNQPAKENALILFRLASIPDSILNASWNTSKDYFNQIAGFIKEQTNSTVFKIDTGLFAILVQAESSQILESRLSGLLALEKPQLITIGDSTYSLQLKLGFSPIILNTFNESSFEKVLATAYNTPLPKRESESELQLLATLQDTKIDLVPNDLTLPTTHLKSIVPEVSIPSTPTAVDLAQATAQASASVSTTQQTTLNIEPTLKHSPILTTIQKNLEKGDIHLKYQQLYDKQDTSLYTYEVTSGFIYENQWQKISSLLELDEDIELSIKLDRWILVEACKQLHNFITQYPEAKLIVNLNRHILFNDKQFPELVAKLITIVGSKLSNPLILQFDEDDIAKNIIESQKQIAVLRDHGAEISIRNFGTSISSEAILKQIDVSLLTLDEKYTQMLNSDATVQKLQELVESYTMIKPVELLLKNLNDMNVFANAWNVDVRFLQGEYFQKKLDHLTDVQDQ
ncbi:EAL domain-containing protein [Acinetobacter sp. ANC 4648]|uniref:EAL domain-containing protein n=1 Tax=Acinetobacter sp. ANC 4648 TaxID=1977875 RepID=UPI000A33BD11|nr:EAL domain-containing protein [Acinetobacter sp. ANC 4648]OTG83565.1 diguanylate phosphodiesterase [Acinetobacter sp. ANC 4648]